MFRNFKYIFCLLLIALFLKLASGQETTPVKQNQTLQQTEKEQSGRSITDTIENETPKIEWGISFAKIFWSLVIFLIAFFSIKYFTQLLEMLGERWNNIRLLIKRMIPIIRITGWTFVLYIIIAGVFAPPIETLIAVTASAGIAVGFASQDILKNIFGGIMILFDRPFQVGDKIAVGDYYGEVIQIGLRSVRVVTADDSLISIPNSDLVNQAVSNSNSGEFNCQVVAEFFLPVHINLERLKKIAYLAAACSKYIYLKKPIAVILKNEIHEGRSILKMRLKAYVLDLRYEFAFSSEMTELVIKQLLDESLVRPEELVLPSISG
ncbi:MAG: mechanosensitive ion channel [Calditrichaceae bacterium]|nr:mechanosensitive ion channel [Calditrichaceae bacterium]